MTGISVLNQGRDLMAAHNETPRECAYADLHDSHDRDKQADPRLDFPLPCRSCFSALIRFYPAIESFGIAFTEWNLAFAGPLRRSARISGRSWAIRCSGHRSRTRSVSDHRHAGQPRAPFRGRLLSRSGPFRARLDPGALLHPPSRPHRSPMAWVVALVLSAASHRTLQQHPERGRASIRSLS